MVEKISHKNNRETFSSKFGFVISCIGAALGLGNIWMFSYRLGTYGGAVFLIPYFLFVFLLGTTGLIAEFTFGRTFRSGSMVGIRKVFKSRNLKGSSLIASIPALGLTGIFVFYSIVIGWILKYFSLSITGEIKNISPTYFDLFSGSISSVPWMFLALIITLSVVYLGVSKGIERLNKIIMPLLLLLFLILTIKSLSLPNSIKGVEYLLKPKWEFLLDIKTWIMALGQAFFTVSLNGCGMVVYGSYTDDKFDIVSSSFATALFDTLAAMLVAFMIMPAVFAFGLNPSSGPSLLFITVPSIDTSVCDMEVRKFNEEATKLKDVTVYVVSMDLPFAQVRWCGNAGIDKVKTLSDYKQKSFGKKYGTLIEEFGFLTRAVFVVDENNKVTYVEYCKDVINEPNYEEALRAVR